MNLELLDPFGRQIPDRIDATLSLPPSLHFFASAAEPALPNAPAAPSASAVGAPARPRKGRKSPHSLPSPEEEEEEDEEDEEDDDEDEGGLEELEEEDEEEEEEEEDRRENTDQNDNDEDDPGPSPAARRLLRGQKRSSAASRPNGKGRRTTASLRNSAQRRAIAVNKSGGGAGRRKAKIAAAVSGGSTRAGGTNAAALLQEYPDWKAAYHLAFNRRGTYLAVGYGSSAVAVFNTSSRTLAALYPAAPPPPAPPSQPAPARFKSRSRGAAASSPSPSSAVSLQVDTAADLGQVPVRDDGEQNEDGRGSSGDAGVTSLTWSRRSRTLLAGGAGTRRVKLYDTTHPEGPEQACRIDLQPSQSPAATTTPAEAPNSAANLGKKSKTSGSPDGPIVFAPDRNLRKSSLHSSWRNFDDDPNTAEVELVRDGRVLETVRWDMGTVLPTNGGVKSGLIKGEERVFPSKLTSTADDPKPELKEDRTLMSPNASDGKAPRLGDRRRHQQPHRLRTRLVTAERRHPYVAFDFPQPVGGALQVNPRIATAGLAALTDGSVVLFYVQPEAAFVTLPAECASSPASGIDNGSETSPASESPASSESGRLPLPPRVWIVPLVGGGVRPASKTTSSTSSAPDWVTCASFDRAGSSVFAATRDGTLLMFDVRSVWDALEKAASLGGDILNSAAAPTMPAVESRLRLAVGGGSTAWHLIVSRNGRRLVLNSSDGALRLFSVSDIEALAERVGVDGVTTISSSNNGPPPSVKPLVFQDVVGRAKFACCDLSGDGEYLVGGTNGDDTKYGLHVWNAATGALLDKLTGPPVQLYSVVWHPCRSFVAVATSDGLVDVWGPRVNWTAFAPDFQSLPHNVEYVEDEDELDANAEATAPVTRPTATGVGGTENERENEEDSVVDVTTVEKVPVFASDSEPEEDAFYFEVRLVNLLAERSRLRVGGKEAKGPSSLLDATD